MKKNLIFLSLFFSTLFFGQSYLPIDTADYLLRKDFLKNFKTNNDVLIKKIKSKYSGKTGSDLGKFYEDFEKDFEKDVKNKDYLFGSVFNTKLDKILSELKKGNPQIQDNLNVLLAKDNTPNAFCLADGTFIINMGIFNWLDNDDQIASVLSHELGHQLREHSLEMLVKKLNEVKTDKETMENIRNLALNKSEKAFNAIKNRIYKNGVEKRKNEIEADSLGYALYKNTSFKKIEFINALKNLKEFDSISPRELKPETYKKLYNLPNQPFKEKWMQKEDFSLYNYNLYKDKLNRDSLLTHPEISKRILILENEYPALKISEEAIPGDDEFKKLRKIARMEILPNFYHSEDYGVGIYAVMQFLQDNEEEEYYKSWLGKCFEKIYEARKNYTLNRYLDRVEPKEQSESYQQFLNFMWNLSLDDIKNISDFYTKKEPK